MRMTFNKPRALFAGLVAAAMLSAPVSALAQKMDVLVMNQQEVLAKSKAGKSIASQIEALAKTAQGELQSEASKLQSEGQALQASKDSLGKEELQKRAQALVAKQQGTAQLGQIKEAEIAQAQAAALSDLSKQLEPVLRDIMKKRRAKVVLRRADVVVMDDDADITDEVIAALDKTVTTVTVTKPDLVAQVKAAQAAQR